MEHRTQNKLLADNIFLTVESMRRIKDHAPSTTFYDNWNDVFFHIKFQFSKINKMCLIWKKKQEIESGLINISLWVSWNQRNPRSKHSIIVLQQELRLFCLNSKNMSSPYINLTVLHIKKEHFFTLGILFHFL